MDAIQKQWFEETKLSWFERFLINVSDAGPDRFLFGSGLLNNLSHYVLHNPNYDPLSYLSIQTIKCGQVPRHIGKQLNMLLRKSIKQFKPDSKPNTFHSPQRS